MYLPPSKFLNWFGSSPQSVQTAISQSLNFFFSQTERCRKPPIEGVILLHTGRKPDENMYLDKSTLRQVRTSETLIHPLSAIWSSWSLCHCYLEKNAHVNAVGLHPRSRTGLQAACENRVRLEINRTQATSTSSSFCSNTVLILTPQRPTFLGLQILGITALQGAVASGNIELVMLLLEKGAIVDAPGAREGGGTALEIAAEQGRLNVLQILLDVYRAAGSCLVATSPGFLLIHRTTWEWWNCSNLSCCPRVLIFLLCHALGGIFSHPLIICGASGTNDECFTSGLTCPVSGLCSYS